MDRQTEILQVRGLGFTKVNFCELLQHFLQIKCPSCHPTNSMKTLKDKVISVRCVCIIMRFSQLKLHRAAYRTLNWANWFRLLQRPILVIDAIVDVLGNAGWTTSS